MKINDIEKRHPHLQCQLNLWIEAALPELHARLANRVKLANNTYLTLDSVTLRMADAALAALLASVEAAGLDNETPEQK